MNYEIDWAAVSFCQKSAKKKRLNLKVRSSSDINATYAIKPFKKQSSYFPWHIKPFTLKNKIVGSYILYCQRRVWTFAIASPCGMKTNKETIWKKACSLTYTSDIVRLCEWDDMISVASLFVLMERDIPSASRAMRTDSTVCSMTPSSAATTSTTRSVARAPRDRIAVNAACPGVSRNVTFSPDGNFTGRKRNHFECTKLSCWPSGNSWTLNKLFFNPTLKSANMLRDPAKLLIDDRRIP